MVTGDEFLALRGNLGEGTHVGFNSSGSILASVSRGRLGEESMAKLWKASPISALRMLRARKNTLQDMAGICIGRLFEDHVSLEELLLVLTGNQQIASGISNEALKLALFRGDGPELRLSRV